jgi:hypothetical protein
MPIEREQRRERFFLYCVDPRDGFGKFSLVTPRRLGPRVLSNDVRKTLANMMVMVDAKAKPFYERLELEISVNEDLVLTAKAWSSNRQGRAETEVHDLEFALATLGTKGGWVHTGMLGDDTKDTTNSSPGDLMMRANLADRKDIKLVPGEVVKQLDPFYFDPARKSPQVQEEEYLYYQPCAYCKRPSNDPLCQCATSANSRNQLEARPPI